MKQSDRDRLEEGIIKKGVKWLLNKAKKATSNKKEDTSKGDIVKKKDMKKIRNFHMYTFVYTSPKTLKSLPYFDALPLIFVSGYSKGTDGLLMQAINIHYLKPSDRVKFVKEIETIIRRVADMKGFDPDDVDEIPHQELTKIIGRYLGRVYKSGGGSAGAHIRQAFRSYYPNLIRSRMKLIPLDEWDQAVRVYLPVFRKKSNAYIYKDIADQYKKYKNNYRSSLY